MNDIRIKTTILSTYRFCSNCFQPATMNPEEFQSVEYQVVNKVANVTLNRPERFNAIDMHMPGELERSIELANYDENVKVCVIFVLHLCTILLCF
jgi:1,4-dihydroxy-2-naphthoyl-CoA synthase